MTTLLYSLLVLIDTYKGQTLLAKVQVEIYIFKLINENRSRCSEKNECPLIYVLLLFVPRFFVRYIKWYIDQHLKS